MHSEQHVEPHQALRVREFRCTADQVPEARRWARAAYAAAGGSSDGALICELLVSEAATNAVVHTDGPVFSVGIDLQDMWVQVEDWSGVLPGEPHTAPVYAESGRGLALIAAFSSEFEVLPTAKGKVVRFRPTVN